MNFGQGWMTKLNECIKQLINGDFSLWELGGWEKRSGKHLWKWLSGKEGSASRQRETV